MNDNFDDFYKKQLLSIIDDIEEVRIKTVSIALFVLFITIICSFIFIVYKYYLPILLILMIGISLFVLITNRFIKYFELNSNNIQALIMYKDCIVKDIDLNNLLPNSHFYNKKDIISTKLLYSGTYHNIPFSFSSLLINRSNYTTNRNGYRHQNNDYLFTGYTLIYQLNKDIDLKLLLRTKKIEFPINNDLVNLKLMSNPLSQTFNLYLDNILKFNRIIDKELISLITNLNELLINHDLSLAINNNNLYIFYKGDYDYEPKLLRKNSLYVYSKYYFDLLNTIKDIINILNKQ